MTGARPRIALDAMGSDTHPTPEIEAAVEAVRTQNVEIFLIGDQDVILPRLHEIDLNELPLHVVHASEALTMTDKPSENVRRKADNSMAVGLELLRSKKADAFLTAGHTGGAMANALIHLGRLRGVKRPGLSGVFPSKHGHVVVLDIGANTECKPLHLVQFAAMGSAYAEYVLEIENPRVGLLSNGEEPGKGNELIRETYPLLVGSSLNFRGNVEAKELYGGEVDVVVTDGFTGNIFLKTSEAATKLLVDTLRTEIRASLVSKIGALLARPAFDQIRRMLDPGEIGAAPLLGVDGLVFIGHGRSDARALVNAIQTTSTAVRANLLDGLRKALDQELERSGLEKEVSRDGVEIQT